MNVERKLKVQRKRAQAAAPVVHRDWSGHVLYERCGWQYIGEPDASFVAVLIDHGSYTGARYAMERGKFDALSDEEFADRMERILITGSDGNDG